MFQQLDHGRHANAVVDRLSQDGRSDALELCGKPGAVADGGLSARTQVDAQRIERDFSLSLISIHQMDRFSADHPGCASFTDKYLLAHQVAHIDASHILETINPFPVIGNDHETNFVHMSVEHDTHPLAAAPRTDGQHIAQRVHFNFLCVRFDLLQDDPADVCLISGYGNDVAEAFQKLELCISEWRHGIIPKRWFQQNFLREK